MKTPGNKLYESKFPPSTSWHTKWEDLHPKVRAGWMQYAEELSALSKENKQLKEQITSYQKQPEYDSYTASGCGY